VLHICRYTFVNHTVSEQNFAQCLFLILCYPIWSDKALWFCCCCCAELGTTWRHFLCEKVPSMVALSRRMTHWFKNNIFMGKQKLHKQHSGRLIESLRMERMRTILTHRYPYPHEHSRHFIIAVFICWLFFISSDNMQTLIMKLDKNFKWWSMYACLIGFFYFFSSPFIRKTIKPNYSNFSRW
jgi:hypothetical protein